MRSTIAEVSRASALLSITRESSSNVVVSSDTLTFSVSAAENSFRATLLATDFSTDLSASPWALTMSWSALKLSRTISCTGCHSPPVMSAIVAPPSQEGEEATGRQVEHE